MFDLFIIVKMMYVLQSQNRMDNRISSIWLADTAILALKDCKYCVGFIVLIREYLTKVGPPVCISILF